MKHYVSRRVVTCLLALGLAILPRSAPAARHDAAGRPALSWNGTFADLADRPGWRWSPNGEFVLRAAVDEPCGDWRRLAGLELRGAGGRHAARLPVPFVGEALVADDGSVVRLLPQREGMRVELWGDGARRGAWDLPQLQDPAFSDDGSALSWLAGGELWVVDLATAACRRLPAPLRHAAAAGGAWLAAADAGRLRVVGPAGTVLDAETGLPRPLRVALDPGRGRAAVLGSRRVELWDLVSGRRLAAWAPPPPRRFRDLRLERDTLVVGSLAMDGGALTAWQSVFSAAGALLGEEPVHSRPTPRRRWRESRDRPEPGRIRWPFSPGDSMRTVWNHYEQHMGDGSDFSYLHQGLDLITPIAEPVFAVDSGVVKCVLTLGGDLYWRTAVSAEQVADTSAGWLYAHLDPGSMPFAPGDTVAAGDYLGEIVPWWEDWGHIHFAEIRDHGLEWSYADDEWGITRNPLPLLDPLTDSQPPVFADVFPGERFAFGRTGAPVYLDPGDLGGRVDVVAKVRDAVDGSPWDQPPMSLRWWLVDLARDSLVVPPRLAHVLDHAYPFYASARFEPYAHVLYRHDETLQPSSWMSPSRDYHLVLTNSDGDSLLTLGEADLGLDTGRWPDGPYRLVAEASDAAGNLARDSLDVVFHNGTDLAAPRRPAGPRLSVRPNPFNPATRLLLELDEAAVVEAELYDAAGRLAWSRALGRRPAGTLELALDGEGLPSGFYLCRVRAGDRVAVTRLTLLR